MFLIQHMGHDMALQFKIRAQALVSLLDRFSMWLSQWINIRLQCFLLVISWWCWYTEYYAAVSSWYLQKYGCWAAMYVTWYGNEFVKFAVLDSVTHFQVNNVVVWSGGREGWGRGGGEWTVHKYPNTSHHTYIYIYIHITHNMEFANSCSRQTTNWFAWVCIGITLISETPYICPLHSRCSCRKGAHRSVRGSY